MAHVVLTRVLLAALAAISITAFGCGPGPRNEDDTADDTGDDSGDDGDDTGGDTCPRCSEDGSAVIDCQGGSTLCPEDLACVAGECTDPCEAAAANNASVGCEYYAVDMDAAQGPPYDACYTVFIANPSRSAVHPEITFAGASIDLATYAKIPVGQGQTLQYQAYDPVAGIEPGSVAIVFLAYAFAFPFNVACPVPAAIGTEAQFGGTGRGNAFHITTDFPVVVYQMLP